MGEHSIDKHLATRRKIEIWCGKAKADAIDWASAGDPAPTYNCFGFALGYLQWWEPPLYIDGILANEEAVWPAGISESVDIETFIEAAKAEGFIESPDAAWEDSVDTIMLFFTQKNRQFQHASKQISPGMWMSKMGFGSDIMHSVDGIDNKQYGEGRVYLKRLFARLIPFLHPPGYTLPRMEAKSPTIGPAAPPQPALRKPLSRGKTPWAALILLASLIAFYAPVLLANMRHAADPMRFNDDARQQIWPFLRYYDAHLFRNDLIADYYLACSPAGYKLLYSSAAKWIDPRSLSKVLPYLLLALTAAAAAKAAGQIEGKWAAWGTAALCLGAPVFLERMGGGLPRAFAFPLYALAALALVGGRPLLLAAVVVIAAGFYPTAAVTCGLALAAMLLLLPARQRGAAARWGLGRRLGLTAAAAMLAGLVVLPTQRAASAYGSILRPSDAAEFPEVGPRGRYADEDRATGLFSRADLAELVRAPLSGLGAPADAARSLFARPGRKIPLWLFAALGAIGTATLAVRDVQTRRLLLLACAALLAHIVSIPLCPYLYLPERYLAYPLPIIAAVLAPAGIAALPLRFAKASHAQSARGPTIVAICGAYLLFLFFTEGRAVRTAGIDYVVTDHQATYQYLRDNTPPDAMIAGFPSEVDDIPYLCQRSVLVSREMHQAFHRDFATRMRVRADSVIDALYAPDRSGLERLRDDFGVGYLIVSKKLYGRTPPKYFAPFDQQIADARRALGTAPAEAQREVKNLAVLKDGDWVVLDLGILPVNVARPATRPVP